MYDTKHPPSFLQVFFIFLQAVSKAGLETFKVLGPVLIDSTPPLVTQQLSAEVHGRYLVTSWNNQTFRDEQQPEEFDMKISYRIGLLFI